MLLLYTSYQCVVSVMYSDKHRKKIDFLALAPIPSIMRMRATSSAVISVLFDL